MSKVINLEKIIEENDLSDFSLFLIETAIQAREDQACVNGFCLVTQNSCNVGGRDYSYSNLNGMAIEELDSYIGRLSVELQRAVFKSNCLKYAEDGE